jgi:prepilin-type N-terminal cleavage/methylation domain-containing protein
VRDDTSTLASRKRHRGDRGFTLVELLVTMSLVAIVMGIALPQFQANRYALWTAQEQLLADLRSTRADALTKGVHFRFDITGASTYLEYRMQFVGGAWVLNGPPIKNRALPAGVQFTSAIGSHFEFNTRGLMLNPGAATQITLTETATTHTRYVTVWPSGQVMPL